MSTPRDRLAAIIGECQHNAKAIEIADALLRAGVTLPAPVAPSLTPLQEAAEALSDWAFPVNEDGRVVKCRDPRYETGARAVLAAAVGALDGNALGRVRAALAEWGGRFEGEGDSEARAALLAALTEEGA